MRGIVALYTILFVWTASAKNSVTDCPEVGKGTQWEIPDVMNVMKVGTLWHSGFVLFVEPSVERLKKFSYDQYVQTNPNESYNGETIVNDAYANGVDQPPIYEPGVFKLRGGHKTFTEKRGVLEYAGKDANDEGYRVRQELVLWFSKNANGQCYINTRTPAVDSREGRDFGVSTSYTMSSEDDGYDKLVIPEDDDYEEEF